MKKFMLLNQEGIDFICTVSLQFNDFNVVHADRVCKFSERQPTLFVEGYSIIQVITSSRSLVQQCVRFISLSTF